MNAWDYAWLSWLAAFVILEGMALARKQQDDTLSEKVWKWFATSRPGSAAQPDGWTRFRRFALLAGLAWVMVHFMTGGWV